jgi:hypothetical protein
MCETVTSRRYPGRMGKIYESIDEKLVEWIGRQHLFFVGTAPTGADGHVNVSPKGMIDTFRILGPQEVAYLDFVGSGVETIAHLRENGRVVVMFCAFEGPPRIVRLHGRGSVTQLGDPRFAELLGIFDLTPIETAGVQAGIRSVIQIQVRRIADSCGHVVPLMRYQGERSQMSAWQNAQIKKYGSTAVLDYSCHNNERSIDDLLGIRPERYPRKAPV